MIERTTLLFIAGFSTIAAVVAVVFAFRASSSIRRVILGGLATLCLIPAVLVFLLAFPEFQPEFSDARLRTYKAFYREIGEGMTRDEINSLLDRHYPMTGPRQRPKLWEDTSAQLCFFMSPEDAPSHEPNCEGIFLSLHDGRVTKKYYSPD